MFGYVKAEKSELRVWEYETYKAIYCSLCRQLGKSYGPLARLTLSYDFTFLAVLALSLKSGCNKFERKRCAFNPLKKCGHCSDADTELEFASAAATVTVYYKVLDNVEDSKGAKRLFYKLLLPFFRSKNRRAEKRYPEISEIVKNYISEQSRLEKEGCTDLDMITEPTSSALGKIFMMCSPDETEKRVLYRLGYCIGKWIYLVDCGEDIEKDMENNTYNPLIKELPENTAPREYAKQRLLPLLNNCITDAGLTFELLNIKKYKGILENIIYLGLRTSQKKALNKENGR